MKERVFERVKPARREFLKKLLAGAAFVSPVIASFSVEALMPDPAYAVPNNQPCVAPMILAPMAAPVPSICVVLPGACGAPVPLAPPPQPAVPPFFPVCTPYP